MKVRMILNMDRLDYKEAIRKLIDKITVTDTCRVSIDDSFGRILAEDLTADEDVPYFARSPYDGYAFKSEDSMTASEENPVTLRVIDDIKAGQSSLKTVTEGTAVRLMTGAPVPEGADAVCMYEETDNKRDFVRLYKLYGHLKNVILPGEDIRKGTLIAKHGDVIDASLEGAFACLGIGEVSVYKKPKAGLISTGDEVVDGFSDIPFGKIRNSNRYSIAAALDVLGFETVYIGHAGDEITELVNMIDTARRECDIIVSTGGVSAGDYDLVPDAMCKAGYEIFVKGVNMKPGMACAYGIRGDSLMLALSGNPASSLTNLQCICYPALRKMCGLREYEHGIVKMKLGNDIKKGGKGVRFIRGRLCIEAGSAVFYSPAEQGNIVLSSAIGCNAYGLIEASVNPLKKGDIINGFMNKGRI